MDLAPCKSDFVTVNGIQLNYLDWGGSGDALLFIPGMGCSPHIFGRFALRFTDRFHVIGFSRRGHGDSDYPETGYDADTLTEDLRQFLNTLGIEQVILVGHSMGYVELSRFAILYPERVIKLVFLDAAYDRNTPEFKAMQAKNPLQGLVPPWPQENPATIEDYAATITRLYPVLASVWCEASEANLRHNIKPAPDGGWVDKMSDAIGQANSEMMRSYDAHYADIRAPMLSIFALVDGMDYLSRDYMDEAQRAQVLEFVKNELIPYHTRYIEQFRQTLPQAQVVVIRQGHHYCFIKDEEAVYSAMREFLEK